MTAGKMRVYELAKELGLSNKALIDLLESKIDFKAKSHTSTISGAQIDKLKKAMNNQPEKKKAPRAILVKKAKPKPVEPVVEEKKEEPAKVEAVKKEETKKPEIKKVEKKEPAKEGKKEFSKPQRPDKKEFSKPRREGTSKPTDKKPSKPAEKENKKEYKPKQPIERRIIQPDAFANKPGGKPGFKKKGKAKSKQDKLDEQEKLFEEAALRKKEKEAKIEALRVKEVVINRPITVGDLSEKIKITSADVVRFLMMEGVLATVNQVIDVETATKVAKHFEIEVLEESLEELEAMTAPKEIVEDKEAIHRAPVVTIMGHVDHGKTTLLDAIRASKHKIVSTEVGGITQSIGAYTANIDDKKIIFLDTPGHEAFTAMRARGAKATDVAILVVAADDGIMPQTIEAINHAKAAEVPIIIAVNKMDKEGANPDRVLQQLTEHGLVPESWGGDTITVNVSALQGTNLEELLEYILLVSEVQDLKANPKKPATGVIIESNLDKGKGPVATLLVQNGTLRVGDPVCVGTVCGKVRALLTDEGKRVHTAGPSTPVEVLGLGEVPQAGDEFEVAKTEKEMKAIVEERKIKEKETKLEATMAAQVRKDLVEQEEEIRDLNIIIKANTHGSAEAVSASVQQLKAKSIIVNIVHIGVGNISEADVMLASASNAIIIGFSIKDEPNALKIAEREKVQIRNYDIIYQILEDIEKTMLGLLKPEFKEVETGRAEVRQIFTVGKTTKIAGCYVQEGKIFRNKTAAVLRDNKEIHKGTIAQLKRFKDDVKEVATGFECGISFSKFNDLEEGDIIIAYTQEEIERNKLEV